MTDKPTKLRRIPPERRSPGPVGIQIIFGLILLVCATRAFPQAQWTEVKLPAMPRDYMNEPYALTHLEWADSLHGYIFAQYKGYFLKTTDGGGLWALDSLTSTPDSLHQRYSWECSGVDFKGRDFGVVSYKGRRRDSLLFYTTDAGATWGYNSIKTNSPFIRTLNPPGSQLRVGNNRDLYLYYTREYTDGVVANVITRSDDYGATWRELGADTLRPDILRADLINFYVMLDSLTHYSFTSVYGLGDFSHSEARVTTDGGRNWSSFPEFHYLWFIDNSEISEVRMINDTSVSIRLFDPNGNGGVCIASMDIHNHLAREAWYVYGHPYRWPNGWKKNVYDLLYHDGTHIASIEDSVMIFRENPPERAQKVYVPSGYFGTFYLQPNGHLWLLSGRLWYLDYRTLGAVHALPAPSPDIEGFECYPQPYTSSSNLLTLRMNSKLRHEEVALVLYDATGRRLYDKQIGDIGPGASEMQLDLSGAPLAQLPSNAVLFIELRTQQQRLFTKTLLINNN